MRVVVVMIMIILCGIALSFAAGEKDPELAFGASCLLPGLGQVYNGQYVKGAVFLGGAILGDGIAVIGVSRTKPGEEVSGVNEALLYGGMGIMTVSYIWSALDAFVVASKGGGDRHGSIKQGLLNFAIKFGQNKNISMEFGMPQLVYYPKDNTLNLTLVDARF